MAGTLCKCIKIVQAIQTTATKLFRPRSRSLSFPRFLRWTAETAGGQLYLGNKEVPEYLSSSLSEVTKTNKWPTLRSTSKDRQGSLPHIGAWLIVDVGRIIRFFPA